MTTPFVTGDRPLSPRCCSKPSRACLAEFADSPAPRVLVIEEGSAALRAVETLLRRPGSGPRPRVSVIGLAEAWSFLTCVRPAVVLLDLDLARGKTVGTIQRLRAQVGPLPLIGFSEDDTEENRDSCLRAGLNGYYGTKSFEPEIVAASIETLLPEPAHSPAEQLLDQTRTQAFRRVVETCLAVAPTGARVLLLGETGTGKELLARAIHGASGRTGPFVGVNCAAVSDSLMQAELFGHERGSFTGAVKDRAGLFEQAEGGTLFLDEIGDMPLPVQAATLRALEEGAIRRVGSTSERRVDVRVVAATSVQLDSAVRAGQFREDLLYRLDVIRAEVPALRERKADVVPLFRRFCAVLADRHGTNCPELDSSFVQALLDYPWPGNVRQLGNFAERLVLTPACPASLDADHFYGALGSGERMAFSSQPWRGQAKPRPEEGCPPAEAPTRAFRRLPALAPAAPPAESQEIELDRPLDEILESLERRYLVAALTLNLGHLEDTAAMAGFSRRTLLRRLKKHGLKTRDFTHRRRQPSPDPPRGEAEG